MRRSIEAVDELWSDVLSAFNDVTVEHRPELVFNWRHPLIRKITSYPPGPALRHAVEALYGQALLAGHHPLRAVDTAALNRSFLALLDRAFTDIRRFPRLIRRSHEHHARAAGSPRRGAGPARRRRQDRRAGAHRGPRRRRR